MSKAVGVRSLYRRGLRVAGACVPDQRAWTLEYVRIKFRDPSTPHTLAARLRDGEEEIQKMQSLLERVGRWPLPKRLVHSPAPPCASTAVTPDGWRVDDVQTWLRKIDAPDDVVDAFASQRVDGSLLREVDETDLRDELRASSRLLRKRILLERDKIFAARSRPPGGSEFRV
jgi:hypothetical protein